MAEIILKLPFPVSGNKYYRNVKGRTLISSEGRAYIDVVRRAVFASRKLKRPLDMLLKAEVALFVPDNRRRDMDNFCGKALFDAMTKAGVYVDDSLIKHQHSIFAGVSDEPYVAVRLSEFMGVGNEWEWARVA